MVNVISFSLLCTEYREIVILHRIKPANMRIRILVSVVLLICQVVIATQSSAQGRKRIRPEHPKNIILLIGDGMGITQVYATMLATNAKLNIERCTNSAVVKTKSADNDVTDSAAGGTAIATGTKTNNGYIGVDTNFRPLKSILKYAEDNGLSTGMVATCDITHATPASFIANVENRNQANEIARQFLRTDIDVFIGGGYKTFAERADNQNLVDSLKADSYSVITHVDELERAPKRGKLAGLLYPGHAPRILQGRGDMLSQSVEVAINILDNNRQGFFLMVEGSQIDWGGHDNDINYVTTELLDFDKAVGLALDFAQKNRETLVIVTADHETGGLTLVANEILRGGLTTQFSTSNHTASPVPLFAFGPGAERFKGIIDNTDIFRIMMSLYEFQK